MTPPYGVLEVSPSGGQTQRRKSSSSGQKNQTVMETFRVFLRVRPYLEGERTGLRSTCMDVERSGLEVKGGEVVLVDERCLGEKPEIPFKPKKAWPEDAFNEVFWSFGPDPPQQWEDTYNIPHHYRSQEYIFRTVNNSSPSSLIRKTFDGYPQCVVTYGALNSGKTYTMFGDQKDPGLAPRFLIKFRSHADKVEEKYAAEKMRVSLKVSVIRVWKETIEDLLSPTNHIIKSLTELDTQTVVEIADEEELQGVIARLCRLRKPSSRTDFTKDNRSHVIVNMVLDQTSTFEAPDGDGTSVVHSKKTAFTLVDLGNPGRTEGESVQEGKLIAAAPQAVNRCFQCLSTRSAVPYRESVLTQILQEQLGGNCHTTVIGCLSPYYKHASDNSLTLDTLRKMRGVVVKVTPAEDKDISQLRQLQRETEQVKIKIVQQSTNAQKVKDALTQRQLQINKLSSVNKDLSAQVKVVHKRQIDAEQYQKTMATTLAAMRKYRRLLMPVYDGAIKEHRTERTALKKKEQELGAKCEAIVDLERQRTETLDDLRTQVDKLAIICGKTVEVAEDVAPIRDGEFDAYVEKLRKLIAKLEKKLKSRKSTNALCEKLQEEIQTHMNELERLRDEVRAVSSKKAKTMETMREVLSEELEAAKQALESRGIPVDTALEVEIETVGDIPLEEARSKAEYLVAKTRLCCEEHDRRVAIHGAYDMWVARLPPLSVYAKVSAANAKHEKTVRRNEEAAAVLEELKNGANELTDTLYERQGEAAVKQGELEALKQVYKDVMEEARWRREKEQEERLKKLEYEENRKKREDEIALAKHKAEAELAAMQQMQLAQAAAKEKGGCCIVS